MKITVERIKEIIREEHDKFREGDDGPLIHAKGLGTYGDDPIKMVFLKNGVCESYVSGEKVDDAKWKAVDGEIHIINEGGISIARININGSLTEIAKIPKGGKRISTPKEFQLTLKKIKSEKETPSKGDDNNSITANPVKELTLEEKVVGEYEYKHINGNTLKQVLLDNGVWGKYSNGKKLLEFNWSIVNGEIHVKDDSVFIYVYRINKDKSITEIGEITDGKRKDIPKEHQWTFKKIK